MNKKYMGTIIQRGLVDCLDYKITDCGVASHQYTIYHSTAVAEGKNSLKRKVRRENERE